jgi:VWFA-related protein
MTKPISVFGAGQLYPARSVLRSHVGLGVKIWRRTVLLLALFVSAGCYTQGQEPPSGSETDTKQPANQSPHAPEPNPAAQAKNRIRTHVNEVIVPVTVIDKKDEFVLDLTQKDFHVFDKGVEQSIDRFDIDADPLAVALVVEANLRLRAMAPVIQGMGSIFTETVMALTGEAAVITYGSKTEVRQPFTQDHDAVEKAIAKIQFQSSDSNLYDAMAKGVELLEAQPAMYRRILLVVGESQDTHSHAKLSQVMREAQLANAVIYAIGPSSTAADLRYGKDEPSGQRPPPALKLPKLPPIAATSDYAALAIWLLTRGTNEISNHQLEIAAATTGGIHYRALHQETIRTALDRIGGELHAQYVLGYAPAPDPYEGFNEIKVTVSRSNVKVRARPGYYVAVKQ